MDNNSNRSLTTYKKKLAIHCKGNRVYFIEGEREKLCKALNSQSVQFIDVGDAIINKYNIEYVEEQNVDDIQLYINSFCCSIRNELIRREKEKIERIGRGFDSIKEIDNYLMNRNISSHCYEK